MGMLVPIVARSPNAWGDVWQIACHRSHLREQPQPHIRGRQLFEGASPTGKAAVAAGASSADVPDTVRAKNARGTAMIAAAAPA